MTIDELMKDVTSLPWHALKYPDVKTWTVACNASVASKLTEADARFVERAANSFPALVEALQDLLEAVDECDNNESANAGDATQGACMECFNCVRSVKAKSALTTALKASP